MNTLALRKQKALLTLSERQEQILIGMLLGDAHLERQRGAVVARLKIEHSLAQSAYVAWSTRNGVIGSAHRPGQEFDATGSELSRRTSGSQPCRMSSWRGFGCGSIPIIER
jgi:hypothetical protein